MTMLRRIRISSQAVFFLLFATSLFFVNRFPEAYDLPADLFLRLNPLVALLVTVAARAVIPSLLIAGGIVAIVTIIFGRIFCGFVCPLGSAIDFSDRFLFGKSRSASRRPPQYLQRLKYVFLFVTLLIAISGSLFSLFFDPISLATRFFVFLVNPILLFFGGQAIVAAGPLLEQVGLVQLRFLTVSVPLFFGLPLTLLLFALVFGGGFFDRRFWCQYVCPSGALFGLFSRFPLFRRRVAPHFCNSCATCSRLCPTRAIDPKLVSRTATAECVVCGVCTDIKESCSAFAFVPVDKSNVAKPDIHRRHLLAGTAGGLLLIPIFRSSNFEKADGHGRFIRPPGALPEKEFLTRCIACGNCMKSCPTNAIQPSTFSGGFHRLFTPKIVPRIGGCDAKCHLCGHVCPTGALRKLSLETKSFAKIGTAAINRHRCLSWTQDTKECLVCDEVCPYNAIEPIVTATENNPSKKVPIVREDLCMGCGICEKHCPITDEAAIIVYRYGENRLTSGEYVSSEQKEVMERERLKSDKSIYAEQPESAEARRAAPLAPQEAPLNGLPPGFID